MALEVIGLVVDDLKASLDFYRLLDLEIPEGAEATEHGHVEAPLGGGLRLAWDTVETIRSFDPDWTPPRGSARVALAFAFGHPSEVDAKYEQLVGLGYTGHKAPWDAFWGHRYAIVTDPDGNNVELFAPLASDAA